MIFHQFLAIELNPTRETRENEEENNKKDKDEKKEDCRDEIIMKLAKAYQESEFRKIALNYNVPSNLNGDIIFKTISNQFYITSIFNQIMVITYRSFIYKWRGMFYPEIS